MWPLALPSLDETFTIHIYAVIGAGASLIASIVFYIFAPKERGFIQGFTVYMLFLVTASILVLTSGGLASPFTSVFMLAVFGGGIFSYIAAIPIIIATGIFVAIEYLNKSFSLDAAISLGLTAILPLVLGLIVWHGHGEKQEDQERKQVKQIANQLSEVANTSEVVINAIGDGVMAVDIQGIVQLINPAAQELLGWAKQDSLMLNYKSILKMVDKSNKDIDPSHDPILQALNTNQEIRSNDITFITKAEKKMLVSIVVSPIGEIGSGVIIVFRDITKEKAEEREQAEFISTASHEMRTPVASIEGYLGLALNPQTSQIDAKARDFITKAHESAQHLGRLFQDLLDVSKAEDGRLSNNPKVIDIVPYIHDIVQGLIPKAQAKGLQLTYKPMADTGNGQKQIAPIYYVNLDNDHIREVTNNLVENAIKYTPAGTVVVDISGTDDTVTISIKDSGIGIPAEDIPHLFQKFYRVDNVDTRQIGGTGLGLYLCRRLAETMGGRLWLESEYKKGSTFFLEVPRIDSSKVAELKQQQDAAAAMQVAAPQAQSVEPGPSPAAAFSPALASPQPVPAQVAAPVAQQAPQTMQTTVQPAPQATTTQPATTVPRGESLTREQIAAHVARLEALAKNQQAAAAVRPGQPLTTAPAPSTPTVPGQVGQ